MIKKNIKFYFMQFLIFSILSEIKGQNCIDSSRLYILYSPVKENHLDFSALKPTLRDKRIICLGEASHLSHEYQQLKVELIKYLHDSLNFKIVLFESGIANFFQEHPMSDTMLLMSNLYPIWHYSAILNLYQYKVTHSDMFFGGIDVQPKQNFFPNYIKSKFYTIDSVLANKSYDLISFLNKKSEEKQKTIGGLIGNFTKQSVISPHEALQLKEDLNSIMNKTFLIKETTRDEKKLLDMALLNYQQLVTILADKVHNNHYLLREKYMSENISRYVRDIFSKEKIIIWAHNGHINKDYGEKNSMISLLPDSIKIHIFSMAISAYEGTYGSLFGGTYPKSIPRDKNNYQIVENIFGAVAQTNKIIFYRFDSQEKLCNQTISFGDGKSKISFVKNYDGIIFFDKVFPSKRF